MEKKEMANKKTPAMLLQELALKERISYPEYSLKSGREVKEDDFLMKVYVDGKAAVGVGRTKQIAKQNAAYSILKKLAKKGICDKPDPIPLPYTTKKALITLPEAIVDNYICNLQNFCAQNKVQQPIYRELSVVGPHHNRKFTIECSINSLRTQASASSKRQAKQEAAAQMLDRIHELIPNSRESEAEFRLKKMNSPIFKINNYMIDYIIKDKRAKPAEFSNHFVRLMKAKDLEPADFKEILKHESMANLKRVMKKFSLQYEIMDINKWPWVMAIDIGVDTAFTMLAHGATEEEATAELLRRTFVALRSYINVADCVH